MNNKNGSRVITNILFTYGSKGAAKSSRLTEYYALREGVDKTMLFQEMVQAITKEEQNNKKEDQIVKDEIKRIEETNIENMLDYLSFRPGSHGLFSMADFIDLNQAKKEVAMHNGIKYHLVVSLREEDAVKLKLTNANNWKQEARKTMPEIGKILGIPLNRLQWYGAFHAEPGHPHAQIIVFDKEPIRRKGMLPEYKLKEIRKCWTDSILKKERKQQFEFQNLYREELRKKTSDLYKVISHGKRKPREETIFYGEKIHNVDFNKILGYLNDVEESLPKTGRLQYGFLQKDVKEKVDRLVDEIFKIPEIEITRENHLRVCTETVQNYTEKEEQINKSIERRKEEQRNIVRGKILSSIAGMRKIGFVSETITKGKGTTRIKNQKIGRAKKVIGIGAAEKIIRGTQSAIANSLNNQIKLKEKFKNLSQEQKEEASRKAEGRVHGIKDIIEM